MVVQMTASLMLDDRATVNQHDIRGPVVAQDAVMSDIDDCESDDEDYLNQRCLFRFHSAGVGSIAIGQPPGVLEEGEMAKRIAERRGSDSDVSSYAQNFVPRARRCVAVDVDRHPTDGTPSYTCIDIQGVITYTYFLDNATTVQANSIVRPSPTMGVTSAVVSKPKSPSPDEDEEVMYLKPSLLDIPATRLHSSAVGIVVHPSGGVPDRPLLPPISDLSQPPNRQHHRMKGKKRAVNRGDAPHNPITIDSSPPQPLTSRARHRATDETIPDHISILPHELRFPNTDFIDRVGLLKAAPHPHGVDPAGYPWPNSIVSGQRSL